MDPNRVDSLVDLAYGALIFVSVVLMAAVGNTVGIAFGLGVLVSYGLHVVWKMARYDPEWMTSEVAETVEETLAEGVTEDVAQTVEETVTEEVDEVKERIDEVNERVDRRPRTEEVEEAVGEEVSRD